MHARLFAVIGCATLGLVGCGDDNRVGDDTIPNGETPLTASPNIDPNATPGEMCPTDESPVVAAYELATGNLLWAACDASPDLFIAEAATDDTVWVVGLDTGPIAFDARTGAELGRGADVDFPAAVPDDADWHMRDAPTIDGVTLSGGQDDPLRGMDAATRTRLWENVGFLAYDDVWAVGDGAVFAIKWDMTGAQPGGWLVGYNIADGTVRWEVDTVADTYGWPWHVADGRLFALWFNVQVLDTADGSTIWETTYPHPTEGFPRMFGAVANDTMVFVSFTSLPSGGD